MKNRLLVVSLIALLMGIDGGVALYVYHSVNNAKEFGRTIDFKVLEEGGGPIPNGAMLVANDVPTLRALVDASDIELAREVNGTVKTPICSIPSDYYCWPKAKSAKDTAYIAADISSSWCVTRKSVSVEINQNQIEVRVIFESVWNCRINGVAALPTASLISFSTRGLKPDLYAIRYVLAYDNKEEYKSANTYLSLPPISSEIQAVVTSQGASALAKVLAPERGSVFSVSRVDGSQLGSLCGSVFSGSQYLVISPFYPVNGTKKNGGHSRGEYK